MQKHKSSKCYKRLCFRDNAKTLFPWSTQSTKNDRQNTNNPDNIQETDKIQKTVLKTKSPYNKKVIEKHIEDNATEIQKDNPTEVKEIKTHREQECVLHPNTREQMLNSSWTLNTVTTVLPSPDTSYIASDVSTFNTILWENANLPSFTEEDLKGKFQWFLEQYKKILLSSWLDREKLIKLRVKIRLRSTIHEAARKDSLTLYIKFLGEVEKDLIRANC